MPFKESFNEPRPQRIAERVQMHGGPQFHELHLTDDDSDSGVVSSGGIRPFRDSNPEATHISHQTPPRGTHMPSNISRPVDPVTQSPSEDLAYDFDNNESGVPNWVKPAAIGAAATLGCVSLGVIALSIANSQGGADKTDKGGSTPQSTTSGETTGNVAATATSIPQPEMGTALPNALENVSQQRYEGEFPFNDILRLNSDSRDNPWAAITNFLTFTEFPNKGLMWGTDSLLTSLTNPFQLQKSDTVFANPTDEPGLGHRDRDIAHYEPVIDVIEAADTMSVDELVNWNSDTGLATFGFYGDAHDADALTLISAMATLYSQDPEGMTVQDGNGTTRTMTVQEVWSSDEFRQELLELQAEIRGETQERFLGNGLSEGEAERRENRDRQDASWQIPADFQDSRDQHLTCDVFRGDNMGVGPRSVDPQWPPRPVEHIDDGAETFNQAHIEREQILFAGTVRMSDNVWDVDRFTARGYSDPENTLAGQIFSAVGEEELPCGQGLVVAPSATPTPAPDVIVTRTPQGATTIITPTRAVVITPTPTGVVVTTVTPQPTSTPAPTQPVQPTATQGGENINPTLVPTPLPTSAPVQTTVPTVPPAAPSSTPAFGGGN